MLTEKVPPGEAVVEISETVVEIATLHVTAIGLVNDLTSYCPSTPEINRIRDELKAKIHAMVGRLYDQTPL